MALRSLPTGNAAEPNRPEYTATDRRGHWLAAFPSGTQINVRAGRARSYPGLRGDAPGTRVFYEALLESEAGPRVLDVGAGSGEGAAVLLQRFGEVVALDHDQEAVYFGRQYAPGATWHHVDACEAVPVKDIDLAVMCDVLAHVRSPEALLRNVRACLRPGGRVFLAEPRAYPHQLLRAPQRRGFGHGDLEAMLTRAGYTGISWVTKGATFAVLMAEADPDPAAWALSSALSAMEGCERSLADEGEQTRPDEVVLAALRRIAAGPRRELALEAHLALARYHLTWFDGEAAARHFIQARETQPSDARGWAGLAALALLTHDVQAAWELSVEAISRGPDDAEAYRVNAEAALRLGDPEALDTLALSYRLAPADALVATRLARLAAEQGDYATGIAAFERLLCYDDLPNVNFHVTFAWLLLMDHRIADAVVHARRATMLAPEARAVAELWDVLSQMTEAGLPEA